MVLLTSLLSLGCTPTVRPAVDHAYPAFGLSTTALEFGHLDWGDSAEQTFTVRNDGGTSLADGMTMGVSGISLLDSASGSYSVRYDVQDVTCASGLNSDHAAALASEVEEVCEGAYVPPEDTGPASTDTGCAGDTGGCWDPEEVEPLVPFTLDPGCSLPVTVTYAPTAATDEVFGALGIDTFSEPVLSSCHDLHEERLLPRTAEQDEAFLAAWHTDPVRVSAMVFLKGTSNAAAEGADAGGRLVGGGVIAASQYRCQTGEVIDLEVLFEDAGEGRSCEWWSDSSSPVAGASTTARWPCPWLDDRSGGKAYLLSVRCADGDGHEDYAYTKIGVFPRSFGLHDPYLARMLAP